MASMAGKVTPSPRPWHTPEVSSTHSEVTNLNDPDSVKERETSLGSDWSEKSEDCGDQHAHSKQPFSSKHLGESSSRQLGEDIAIEEHAKDNALNKITLRSHVLTNKRSHDSYGPIRGHFFKPMGGHLLFVAPAKGGISLQAQAVPRLVAARHVDNSHGEVHSHGVHVGKPEEALNIRHIDANL